MNLLCVGCNFKTTGVELREKLAFDGDKLSKALTELTTHYDCEAVILSTCNRVEMYIGQSTATTVLDTPEIVRFLSEQHKVTEDEIARHLYTHHQGEAARHLFRVASSLDSLIIGEAQISGQVKKAYEQALELATTGPLLNGLFQRARIVAKRTRTETGIAQGHVSVSSAAVDYVRQVYDHFSDKTVLVIGAGKMGELTLRHLRELEPGRILVTNRSPEKAEEVAKGCGGEPMPFEGLDRALAKVDIVLSTTGASEPIVTEERYKKIVAKRSKGTIVILDIAVPRDFDPNIHDGETTFLFNIDDLLRVREATLADRSKHIEPAEAIVEEEAKAFLKDLARRRNVPVIAKLNQDVEAKRHEIVSNLLNRFNGKLDEDEKKYIEKAFQLFQQRILHGPLAALNEAVTDESLTQDRHTLLDALRKLFRLS